MKTPETINSRSWAREARRHCRIRKSKFGGAEYIHAWIHTIEDVGWIQARPCYVWGRGGDRWERYPVLTGGWVIKVQPRDPEYMKTRPRTKVFHVAGPVDLDKLSRAMARAEVHLRRERSLVATREALKRLVDSKRVPRNVRNVRKVAEKRGLPMSYVDMSPEDCQRWATIVAEWPDKARAQA